MPRFLKAHRSTVLFAALLLAQLVLLSLQVPLGSAPSLFERAAFAILSPVQSGLRAVTRGVREAWDRYIDLRRVESRNRELGEEVLRLREENVLLRNGLAGLQDREAAAAVLRDAGRAFFFARVIGLDAANEHMSAVIDKGSRHGLKADLPVLDTRGRLVGRIIAPIETGTATVQLVTDGDIAVGVYGEGKRVLGILSGDSRNGLCRLKYVLASNEDLAVGEALFTSGQDRIFPRGILVGEVTAIAVDGSLFKRISVRPSLDLRQLAIVAVLTGPVGE